ncbi:MAG: hypothetical protein JWP37_530 [Mucilaginibacter sp.]|nr:hypothetical protein [Mucilaginibacter sp.]
MPAIYKKNEISFCASHAIRVKWLIYKLLRNTHLLYNLPLYWG